MQRFKSKLFFLISSIAFVSASMSCVQQDDSVRPVAKNTPAKSIPTSPAAAQPAQTTTENGKNPGSACPAGSEPATPDLRDCCRTRNWGKACDGGCWAAGVGEKLAQMCNGKASAGNDCSQSPDKSKTSEWCNFHYNRRYCGISDSDWLATCKSSPTQNTPQAPSNDCGSSPAKTQTRDWCNFHYNRRYCGISDAEWVQTCTPASAASASPAPAATSGSNTSAPCKITQNRGFPYPPCPQRTTAKICEEGPEGKEAGKYCVWTGQ
ncbi:MAG: hypothetical protein ACO3A4_10195 [Silvanigrellaceae bacterium]